MSLSLFHARHFKSSRNLRKLLISSPITSPINSPVTSSCSTFSTSSFLVILRVRFNFVGESYPELSVTEGDYVKLIERLENGWLIVQCIDRAESGIVPALYVEVEVNDPENPITNEWLCGIKKKTRSFRDYPKSAKISQVLLNSSGHLWYLYKVVMHSEKTIYFGKLYQDFYNLHSDLYKSLDKKISLPPLPKPISICGGEENELKLGRILKRCKELDDYQHKLLHIPEVCNSPLMAKFIKEDKEQCVVFEKNEPVPPNDILVQMIYKDSNNIHHFLNVTSQTSFSTTAPLPRDDGDVKTKVDIFRESQQSRSLNYMSFRKQSTSQNSPRMSHKGDYFEHSNLGVEKDAVSPSKSSHTLSSFSSLIDSYDDTGDTSDCPIAAK